MLRFWITVAVLVSHFGAHLTIYNRINSLGWPRRYVKRLSKTMLLFCLIAPLAYFRLADRDDGGIRPAIVVYGAVVVTIAIPHAVLWLLSRPGIERHELTPPTRTVVDDVSADHNLTLPRTRRCRTMAMVPGNQMFELSVDRIDLPVDGLPEGLDGYRIAHLSDVHFTGHVDPSFTARAVEHAMRFEPDLMALTGDVIDHPIGWQWIASAFGPASATDGCYFILGNHDLRVSDPNQTRQRMSDIGWIDAASDIHRVNLSGRQTDPRPSAMIIGDERPWFDSPSAHRWENETSNIHNDNGHRPMVIALCHTPDRFQWARRHGVTLMLAGHTHGGQGRLPLAGPILSPSRHGSRYAGGTFSASPTTMHVNRGLSGTHLLRIRCRPQVSLLTLRCRPPGEHEST